MAAPRRPAKAASAACCVGRSSARTRSAPACGFLSRSADGDSSESVRLDFGLSNSSLDEKTRAAWPYAFDLVYSVTLEREDLTTTLVVNNKEEERAFGVSDLGRALGVERGAEDVGNMRQCDDAVVALTHAEEHASE